MDRRGEAPSAETRQVREDLGNVPTAAALDVVKVWTSEKLGAPVYWPLLDLGVVVTSIGCVLAVAAPPLAVAALWARAIDDETSFDSGRSDWRFVAVSGPGAWLRRARPLGSRALIVSAVVFAVLGVVEVAWFVPGWETGDV